MFTLVVFTLVVGAVVTGSFVKAFDDPEKFGGGFDIRAQASPTNPIGGMEAAIRRAASLDPAQFTIVSEQFAAQRPAGRPLRGEELARARRRVPAEHDVRIRGQGARLRQRG